MSAQRESIVSAAAATFDAGSRATTFGWELPAASIDSERLRSAPPQAVSVLQPHRRWVRVAQRGAEA